MTVLAVGTSHSNTRWGGVKANSHGPIPFYEGWLPGTWFDDDFVRANIRVKRGYHEPFFDLGANYSELWLHFDTYFDGNPGNNDEPFVEFLSAAGEYQFALMQNTSSTNNDYDVNKSTNGTSYGTTLSGGVFTIPNGTLTTVDVYVKVHGTTGEFKVYINGTLDTTFSGNTSTNGDNAIRYITFRGTSAFNDKYVSQVIVADVSTIGWKVQEITPSTGTQDFSAWTGDYTTVDDITYSTSKVDSLFTNTANNVETFPVPDVTSAASGMSIQAVVVSARMFAEAGSSVDNVQLGVSIGGTFYPSSTFTVGEGNGEVVAQYIMSQNPATSSGWDASAINNLQIGVKAVA